MWGAGGRRTVSVGVQGEGEVCGGAGEGGGGVCDRAVEAQDSSKKSEYGGVEGVRSVHGDGEVCVCGVCGGSACV